MKADVRLLELHLFYSLPIAFKQIGTPGKLLATRSRFVAHEPLEGPDSELVARLNTAYRKVLVVGKMVYVPPIYSARARPYQFRISELRLMYHLANGESFDKACDLAAIGKSKASKFLKSREYKEFAMEAVEDEAIFNGWTPRRIVLEVDRIYRGQKVISPGQFDALKLMKEMVAPRKSESFNGTGVTVNLNFPVLPADVQTRLKALADEAATIDVENAA